MEFSNRLSHENFGFLSLRLCLNARLRAAQPGFDSQRELFYWPPTSDQPYGTFIFLPSGYGSCVFPRSKSGWSMNLITPSIAQVKNAWVFYFSLRQYSFMVVSNKEPCILWVCNFGPWKLIRLKITSRSVL